MEGQRNSPDKDSVKRLCVHRPRSELADRQHLIELVKSPAPIALWRWYLAHDERIAWPLLQGMQPSARLRDMGIGFDLSGFTETDLPNYDQIVDAFSHCFYPGLFDQLHIPNPYAAWPYEQTFWDGLFRRVSPQGFIVAVSRNPPGPCFGNDGDVSLSGGTFTFSILDCTPAPHIMHEIGHVIMDGGILWQWPPLYYHYATGGTTGQTYDAINDLNALFGNYSAKDRTGRQLGFVSDYAMTNQQEDFAETLMYYVYYPDEAYPEAARQIAAGSNFLDRKLAYIGRLYKGMVFRPGGAPDSWPGFPI